MNTAIKLNEAISGKSSTSKLVIINLPGMTSILKSCKKILLTKKNSFFSRFA